MVLFIVPAPRPHRILTLAAFAKCVRCWFDYRGRLRDNKTKARAIQGRLYVRKNGPVAQLGARFHGMEEVVGSNPTRSTITHNSLTARALTPQRLCISSRFDSYRKDLHRGSLRSP